MAHHPHLLPQALSRTLALFSFAMTSPMKHAWHRSSSVWMVLNPGAAFVCVCDDICVGPTFGFTVLYADAMSGRDKLLQFQDSL